MSYISSKTPYRTDTKKEFINMIKQWEQQDLVDLITDLVDDNNVSEDTIREVIERCTRVVSLF